MESVRLVFVKIEYQPIGNTLILNDGALFCRRGIRQAFRHAVALTASATCKQNCARSYKCLTLHKFGNSLFEPVHLLNFL